MRGTNVVGARIEKWRKVEKQATDYETRMIARMCRRELEWVLGMAPQEMGVKG